MKGDNIQSSHGILFHTLVYSSSLAALLTPTTIFFSLTIISTFITVQLAKKCCTMYYVLCTMYVSSYFKATFFYLSYIHLLITHYTTLIFLHSSFHQWTLPYFTWHLHSFLTFITPPSSHSIFSSSPSLLFLASLPITAPHLTSPRLSYPRHSSPLLTPHYTSPTLPLSPSLRLTCLFITAPHCPCLQPFPVSLSPTRRRIWRAFRHHSQQTRDLNLANRPAPVSLFRQYSGAADF